MVADRRPDGSGDASPGPSEDRLASLLRYEIDGPASKAAAPAVRGFGRDPVRSLAALAVLFLLGAMLVWVGVDTIRTSTAGDVVTEISDPTAPGFEALADTTPTMAVLHDLDGVLDAIAVLTLPDAATGGGAAVMVPTRVMADLPVLGVAPLEAAYDLGTPEQAAAAVGDLFGAAMAEVVVVDADRWAGLVEPVAPLAIDNPDDFVAADGTRFPDGPIQLDADEVGTYLEARIDGESELARLFRHEVFWAAWIAAVAADGAGVESVPGELEAGIGRFVRDLARGDVLVDSLDAEADTADGFEDEPVFVVDEDDVADLTARIVPLPRSPRPGVRSRTRILNGTTDTDAAAAIASTLTPAGLEVVLLGNAATLDVAETTVAYLGDEHRVAAEAVVDLLGHGRIVEETRPSDSVDITVTLGADHG